MPKKRKAPEKSETVMWSSLLDGKWVLYGADDVAAIEKAWEESKATKTTATLTLSFSKGAVYEFDFSAMTQINVATKRSRKIRRTIGAAGAASSPAMKLDPKGARARAPAPAAAAAGASSKKAKVGGSSGDLDFGTALLGMFSKAVTAVKADKGGVGSPSRSTWALDSDIPDGPPLKPAEIKAQAKFGSQSRRGRSGPDDLGHAVSSHKHAAHCFEKMLENEQRMSGEWAVFYHSYSHAALLYEVQVEILITLPLPLSLM